MFNCFTQIIIKKNQKSLVKYKFFIVIYGLIRGDDLINLNAKKWSYDSANSELLILIKKVNEN